MTALLCLIGIIGGLIIGILALINGDYKICLQSFGFALGWTLSLIALFLPDFSTVTDNQAFGIHLLLFLATMGFLFI